MGNTIFEVKNTLVKLIADQILDVFYDRLNNTEEKMGKPEDNRNQYKMEQEKKIALNNEKASVTVGQCQNILTYV